MVKKKTHTSLVVKLAIVAIVIAAVFFYSKAIQQARVEYAPCAVTANGSTLPVVEVGEEMVGSSDNAELFIAAPEGSRIFAKAGLNYIIANDGPDEFYFSLCSSKIIDGKVVVIENFDPKKDKIKIFCAHHKVAVDQLRIIHDEYEGMPVTYVEVKGKKSVTAIALLGDVDIKPEDIVLNEPFVKKEVIAPVEKKDTDVIPQIGE